MAEQPQAETIFGKAIEIGAVGERNAFLDGACHADAALRQEVDKLVHDYFRAGEFLEQPVAQIASPTLDQPITEKPGTQIGPYKLLQQIGEGGMGVVYMAEQKEPVKRRVAMKIIKPGMDTKQVIARFEAERQALAMMDHPNIAKVLDAGATEGGRPYFVMELVKGVPVTKYCDEQHLAPKERLELFVPICQAVQHAHQKGIIHRDLKPSNILVALYDGQAVPKIIDFGVAKATSQTLTEKTMFTQLGQVVGTLEYMSPEQAQVNQLDVDTRCDVYSLGVVLYELLTGETPFDRERLRSAAFDEMLRIIREEEPSKPSTKVSSSQSMPSIADNRRVEPAKLGSMLRGELDWIVLKAMEKDRGRRYETASKFAEDVQHYLNDEPVVACPPSTAYRLRKFVRRHKVAIMTASLVTVAVILGLVGTASQAVRANIALSKAVIERSRAVAAEKDATALRVRAEAERDRAEIERETAKRLLTSSQIDRAQALCEAGEIGRGMLWYADALKTAPEDAADLEQVIRANLAAWHLELHSLKMVVHHDAAVTRVAYSPDGSRILSVAGEGTLRLSDAVTGRAIGGPLHHEGLIALAFSPDGTRFVTGNKDKTAQIWDAATLEPIGLPLSHDDQVYPVAFSPDGSKILTGTVSGTVSIWDTHTREPLREPFRPEGIRRQNNSRPVRAVAFTSAGIRAVFSFDSRTLQLWDIEQGQPIGPTVSNQGMIRTAAISPDGSKFAAAGMGGTIQVWNPATTDESSPSLTHGAEVFSLAFSGDGSRLVSGGNERAARLWDTTTGRAVGVPMRHRGTVFDVAFSCDGQHILTGSEDGTARLWEIAPQPSLGRAIQHDEHLVTTAFSVDGLRILTEREGMLQIRDADTGRSIGEPFPGKPGGKMCFSPDGSLVWLHGQIRDLNSGRVIPQPDWGTYVHALAFSPDGSRILTSSFVGQGSFGRLWDTRTALPIGLPLQHQGVVSSVAFSPGGSRIATGSYDGTTQVWDAKSQTLLGPPMVHQSELKSLAWNPDGRQIATGFADWTVRLWDAETREPIGLPLHHENIVTGTAFSPDGARLLTVSLDETARLWDTTVLKPVGPPLRHRCYWPQASFDSDGRRILAAGWSGVAHVWKAPPGPLAGDVERLVQWAQVVTGLELDSEGGIGVLDGKAWQERKQRLLELGGTPATSPFPGPVRPPIETDFTRAMKVALEGLRLAEKEQWDEAASEFHKAVQRSGDSLTLRDQIACWWDHFAANQSNSNQEACEKLTEHAIALLQTLGDDVPNTHVYHEKLDGQYTRLLHVFEKTGRLEEALHAEKQRVAVYSELADRFPDEARYGHELVKRQITLGIRLSRLDRTAEAEALFAGASRRLESIAEVAPRNDHERWVSWKFHQDVAELFASGGRDREVMVSYQRVLELNPRAHWIHHRLARLLFESLDPGVRDLALAVRHARLAAETVPQPAYVLKTLADAHASLALQHASAGREQEANTAWHKAAEAYAKAVELQPRNMSLWHGYTLAQLAIGPEAYSQVCSRLLKQFGRTEEPGVALSVAWFCGLGPGATSDPQRSVELAEQVIARLGKDKNRLYVLSAALYRAGRYEEAIEELRKTIAARGDGGFAREWFYLAMAHHHLGDAEARRCFEKACQWLETAPAGRWTGELHGQLLRREAAELLQIPESEQSDSEAAASPTPRLTD